MKQRVFITAEVHNVSEQANINPNTQQIATIVLVRRRPRSFRCFTGWHMARYLSNDTVVSRAMDTKYPINLNDPKMKHLAELLRMTLFATDGDAA